MEFDRIQSHQKQITNLLVMKTILTWNFSKMYVFLHLRSCCYYCFFSNWKGKDLLDEIDKFHNNAKSPASGGFHPHFKVFTRLSKHYLFTSISALPNISMSNVWWTLFSLQAKLKFGKLPSKTAVTLTQQRKTCHW